MFLGVYWLNPRKANVFGCILELPCLSGRLSVCPTVNKILVSVKALAGGGARFINPFPNDGGPAWLSGKVFDS